ncbi:hypothetical protein PIB30_073418 [Stylosanthes scabra]|uniref:Uncharacterized protein n=1 Tax=Stylosanthes scabra TaxID=79078 RepID=A0ABU6ZN86_9FABA|nr:hypothetical protein [Stylosanthes scabra]
MVVSIGKARHGAERVAGRGVEVQGLLGPVFVCVLGFECEAWAKRVCGSGSTPRRGVPRLGVAGYVSRVGKMKKGSLRSKERSLEAILAKSPTHRRGSWRLCMLHHEQTTPRHPLIKPRHGHQLGLSTHRRRYLRIYAWINNPQPKSKHVHA